MTLFLARGGKFGENENYFLENNQVCMCWEELAGVDLTKIKTQEDLKKSITEIYQDSSKKTIQNWASQIWIPVNRMQIGDFVVMPLKSSRKIAIGEITSDYIFDIKQKPYSHIRRVKWIKKDIPRTAFDQEFLYSIGAFMTFCEISKNDAENKVKKFLANGKLSDKKVKSDDLQETIETPANLEEFSQDSIAGLIIRKFKGKRLEYLVENILRAKGYFTYKSPDGSDRGVDVLAAKGDLGFESPKICVQVKSGETVGRDIIDRLTGTMKKVGADYGLLVSWEGFKSTVDKEERQSEFFRIRLWEQKELIEEFLNNYSKLDEEIKSEIPLKQIWVIAEQK
jgi:restriction system protein